MIRRCIISAAVMLSVSPAVAQGVPQPPVPMQEALGQKLFTEINAGLTCNANLLSAQKDLDAARARIKELEAKATAPATAPEAPATAPASPVSSGPAKK